MTRCQNCGYEVQTRAAMGEGTQRAKLKKSLTLNDSAIAQIIFESEKPLTVKQVQGILYKKEIRRQQRREKIPSGPWNYHQVQIVLSTLLGLSIAAMSKTEEFWNKDQEPGATPTPRYFMTAEQTKRFQEILLREGRIQLSLHSRAVICPKCGAIIR